MNKDKVFMMLIIVAVLVLISFVSIRFLEWDKNAKVCDENGGAVLNTMMSSSYVNCYMWDNGYIIVRNGNFETNDVIGRKHDG